MAVKAAPANSTALPVINSIFDFSEEALGQLKTWIEQAGLAIPITQIIGFSQFTANYASISTQDTTSSTSYTDLSSTTGPTLTGLSNGTYLVLVTAVAKDATGSGAFMSVSPNGGTAQDIDGGETQTTVFTSIIGISKQTLSAGNNTLTAKYKSNGGGVCTFLNRQLFALKISNQ